MKGLYLIMKSKSRLFFLVCIIIVTLILSSCQIQKVDESSAISSTNEQPNQVEDQIVTEMPNVTESPNMMASPYKEEKPDVSVEPNVS